MTFDRRRFLSTATASLGVTLAAPLLADQRHPPIARVIVDNDFAGDPDGLFQLAHHLLCRSVEIPLIIGSHLPPQFGGATSATAAVSKVRALLEVMGRTGQQRVIEGSETAILSPDCRQHSPATAAIIAEAMRTDVSTPLFYAAGGGLTDLALAWIAEPRIARRLRLVWIGGPEHPGIAVPPPGADEVEFNLSLDPAAAQLVFNRSDIEIWQVPRDAYRAMLFPRDALSELAGNPIGRFLVSEIDAMEAKLATIPGFPPLPASDVVILGDSPLVTLTGLLPPLQPDPSSSRYVTMPTPMLTEAGGYRARPDGRALRVYTAIDTELTFRDMTAKFRRFGNIS